MKPFICRGRQVEVGTVTGEVVGTHKHAETHVSGGSTGSSTYVSGGSPGGSWVHTSPVSIRSTVVTKQEFFIKCSDGQEEVPIKLTGLDIPLRDGQRVTMISGEVQGNSGSWMRLVNHNANRFWNITDTIQKVQPWGLVRGWGIRLLIGWAIFLSGYMLTTPLVNFALSMASTVPQVEADVSRLSAGNDPGKDRNLSSTSFRSLPPDTPPMSEAWIDHAPTVAQVFKDVQGTDQFDTSARQEAVFDVLQDSIRTWTGGIGGHMSPRAAALLREYNDAAISKAHSAGLKFIDGTCSGEACIRKLGDKVGGYMSDPRFVREALGRYFSTAYVEAQLVQVAWLNAELAPKPRRVRPPVTVDTLVSVILDRPHFWFNYMLTKPDGWKPALFMVAGLMPVWAFLAALMYWWIEARIRKRVAKRLDAYFDEAAQEAFAARS